MLEAKLQEASVLKKLLDAIKELVTDANFECNEEGINLQAMDNSHVALVAVLLEAPGFKRYRCDRPMPLGVNLASLTKVLKCAKDDDECTIKAADEADVLNLVYEAKHTDRIAEYDMKLMDIDSDTLGIPETDYDARVTMASTEFGRIVRDLSLLGESVRIEVSKEGVRFASDGEAANGSVLLKPTEGVGKVPKKDEDAEEEQGEEEANDDNEDEDEAEDGKKIKKEKTKVKKEKDTEDVEMDGEEENDNENFKPEGDDDEEKDSDDEESGKKRKKKQANGASSKKAKTVASSSKGKGKKKEKDDDKDFEGVIIELNQHVSLTFSLKYLVNFSKSQSLCAKVQLMMSNDVPLLVSYEFGQGHIRYYLAPKIGDD
ncbi:proliferating cell nuclear antigen, N-terminal domain-containing protein [Desarmillaria tabescens]|uniref:DNA sliding clamp PCNA n=1 Tax=Armillaria tabescens TaxID=1929756 RepID=A0AA39NFH5_ARMTA|nr:proliferating cell nuclear antigen, N-terminal domain-containing protein [Desarmillaria tabescens]KAK0464692.1 proliferating cell nuclear antigen, N-terminal domain-containing protein [Desarmillaria tabescens]